jgi:hypothetical protein
MASFAIFVKGMGERLMVAFGIVLLVNMMFVLSVWSNRGFGF